MIVYIYLYHNYLPPHAKHSHFLADHPVSSGFSVEPRYKVRSGIYSHHDYKLKLDFTPGQGVKDSQKKILIPTELCLLLPLTFFGVVSLFFFLLFSLSLDFCRSLLPGYSIRTVYIPTLDLQSKSPHFVLTNPPSGVQCWPQRGGLLYSLLIQM